MANWNPFSMSGQILNPPSGDWIPSGNYTFNVSLTSDETDSKFIWFLYKVNSGSWKTLKEWGIDKYRSPLSGQASLNLVAGRAYTIELYGNNTVLWGPYTFVCTPVPSSAPSDETPAGYQSSAVSVNWSSVQYAQTYQISYTTDGTDPDTTADITGLTGTSYTFQNVPVGAVLKWRVRAVNLNGNGPWSSVYQVETYDYPSPPVIDETYVANNETAYELQPTLGWHDSGSGPSAAVSFNFYLDETENVSTLLATNITTTSYKIPYPLEQGKTYYWKVEAVNPAGTAVSAVYTFQVFTVGEIFPASVRYKKRFWAIAGNRFYYENDDSPSKMVHLYGLVLDTTKPIQAFEAFQKVFIVNYDKKWVVDFSNTKLVLEAKPTVEPKPSCLLVQETGSGTAGMIIEYWDGDKTLYGYKFTEEDFIDDTILILDGVSWIKTAASNCQTAPDPPLFYPWMEFGGTEENMPKFASSGCLYRGRGFLGGDTSNPGAFYMSRQGNLFDFAYAADDEQSPIAGTGTHYGKLGDSIKSVIPYAEDYAVLGCSQSIWIITGDPASGGQMQELTRIENCFSSDSWCLDDSGRLYILGTGSLIRISDFGRTLENLTRDVLPNYIRELNLDEESKRVACWYDKVNNGILFSITDRYTNENNSIWFDLRTGGLFLEEYPQKIAPYSMAFYESENVHYRKLVLGCADGILRIHEPSNKADIVSSPVSASISYSAIESYIVCGPLQFSENRVRDYILTDLVIVSAGGGLGGSQPDSGAILYEVHVGRSAEEAMESVSAGTPFLTGIIQNPGRSIHLRTRMRGIFACLKIGNAENNQTWSFEEILAESVPADRRRYEG